MILYIMYILLPLVLLGLWLLRLLLSRISSNSGMDLLVQLLNVIWLNSPLNVFAEVSLILLGLILNQRLQICHHCGSTSLKT